MFKIWSRCDYSAPVPGSGQGKGTKWDVENKKLTRGIQNWGEGMGQDPEREWEQLELEGPVMMTKVGRGQTGHCWSHFMTLYPKSQLKDFNHNSDILS